MSDALHDLVEISRRYGADPDFVIAGGGNTSCKDDNYIWVKASGFAMGNITGEGFVQLSREKVQVTGTKRYSDDPYQREEEVKGDLLAARVYPESGLRPSVETSLHEVIGYPFVVHTHPTLVNGLMCSVRAATMTKEIFGEKALFVEYAPGYGLFKKVSVLLEAYKEKYHTIPHLIFLQNHGIFVGADSVSEIHDLYNVVIGKIREKVEEINISFLPQHPDTTRLLHEIRAMAPGGQLATAFSHNTLHADFYGSAGQFAPVAVPFIPDIVVYCGPAYLYTDKPEFALMLADLRQQWNDFNTVHGKNPTIILVKGFGAIGTGESQSSAETALEVFEDAIKIGRYARAFGGPHPMSADEIAFIDGWEVEQYRRRISQTK